MKWGDPLFLRLLPGTVILLGILLLAARLRRQRIHRLADPGLWPRVAVAAPRGRNVLYHSLLLLALAACLLGAARPLLGARTVQVKRSGIDAILALDLSASMNAADVVPSRLARARREMADLIDKLRGDRVGIVAFEGAPFLLCPLTLDYSAARLFLDSVEIDMLPIPGTNLAEAIRAAVRAFPREGDRSRAVVVFSDGETHESDVEAAAKEAREADVKIYCVGVGTTAGEPIPTRDDSGQLSGYKKDRAGEVVLSRLNDSTLRLAAETTGGAYYPATLAGSEIEQIYKGLSGLSDKEIKAGLRTQYEERFQFFAGLAAACLLGALLLPVAGRKEEWHGRF